MQTIEIQLFTIQELKELHPDGYKRALEKHERDACRFEIPWQDEICDSLKALVEAAGLRLRDWSIGAYSRGSFCRVSFENGDAGQLTGKRAFAWLENNLFAPLRIPWKGKERWRLAAYNRGYHSCHPKGADVRTCYSAGRVQPAPFTGYYADDVYIDHLRDSLKCGLTLKRAFEALADKAQELLEEECEQAQSEEAFLERCEIENRQFTEDGEEWND